MKTVPRMTAIQGVAARGTYAGEWTEVGRGKISSESDGNDVSTEAANVVDVKVELECNGGGEDCNGEAVAVVCELMAGAAEMQCGEGDGDGSSVSGSSIRGMHGREICIWIVSAAGTRGEGDKCGDSNMIIG